MQHLVVYRKADGAIQRVVTRTEQRYLGVSELGFNPVLFGTCRVVTSETFVPSKWKVENNILVRLVPKEQELIKDFSANKKKNIEGYKIVFIGDPPSANTGFGTQYRLLRDGLRRRGHTIETIPYSEIPKLVDVNCDFVIALSDYSSVRKIFNLGLSNLIYWFALESPEWPKTWNKNLQKVPLIVPLTDYGMRALNQKGIKCATPIPHGVSTEIFKPIPVRQRGLLRQENEVSNRFVISYIGTNVQRKRLDLLIETFAKFIKEYDKEQKSLLLLKTKIDGYYNLEKLIAENVTKYEIPTLGSSIRFIEKEMTDQGINQLINISDVGINTTSGEGFCVPVMEYMMCGVPFIAGRHTSFPELIGNLFPLASIESTKQDGRFKWTRYNIDADHAVQIVAQFYNKWKEGKVYDRAALRDVAMKYTSDETIAKWDRLLREQERKMVEKEWIERAASSLLKVESSEKDRKLYEKAIRAVENQTTDESADVKWIKVF